MEKSLLRVANTVVYLFGRTGLVWPGGPKSLQAHRQPASTVKIMRSCYRILIHWKSIFRIPHMGFKVTREYGCEITCLSLPPLSPLVFPLEVKRPSLSHLSSSCDNLRFLRMPPAEGLHEWNAPILSWTQPARGNALKLRPRITMLLKIFLMDFIQSNMLTPNPNNA